MARFGTKNNRSPGVTGERYICMSHHKGRPFAVVVSSHKKYPRQIKVGYATTLEAAIEMRDKYLESQ